MDAEERKRLERGIREFGLVDPIIARRSDGLVIGGHQRLTSAIALKLPTVPVVYLDDISDDRAAALNILLNNPSAQGEWDMPKLTDILSELDAHGFDASLTGFDPPELRQLLDDVDPTWMDLGVAPVEVERTAEELTSMKADRRKGNEQVAERGDTERYLIIVFPSRRHKEAMLVALGCEPDERYLPAEEWHLARRRRRVANRTQAPRTSDNKHTGAVGGFA